MRVSKNSLTRELSVLQGMNTVRLPYADIEARDANTL